MESNAVRGLDLVKKFTPRSVKLAIKRSPIYVRHQSEYENIYHCCVQKTASEWVRQLLRDERVYRYSGLTVERQPAEPDERNLFEKEYSERAVSRKIISPLYTDYLAYERMPKPAASRAFFVQRDPRDIVVSWYYSARWSHPVENNAPLRKIRDELGVLSVSDGLSYSIRFLKEYGLFNALLSWQQAVENDDSVLLVKYEDLIGSEQNVHVLKIFHHCDIRMPSGVLESLLSDLSFVQLSNREKAVGSGPGHYRSGRAGDWLNHFDSSHLNLFEQKTGDLVERLGY